MNLIDPEREIKNVLNLIHENGEHLTSVEMTRFTFDYLNSKGIHGFKNGVNETIPIILNEALQHHEIKLNREKNIKPTEYEPYEMIEEQQ